MEGEGQYKPTFWLYVILNSIENGMNLNLQSKIPRSFVWVTSGSVLLLILIRRKEFSIFNTIDRWMINITKSSCLDPCGTAEWGVNGRWTWPLNASLFLFIIYFRSSENIYNYYTILYIFIHCWFVDANLGFFQL